MDFSDPGTLIANLETASHRARLYQTRVIRKTLGYLLCNPEICPELGQSTQRDPFAGKHTNKTNDSLDSYRQPIDTQTTTFRHPKSPILAPAATA